MLVEYQHQKINLDDPYQDWGEMFWATESLWDHH